MASTSGKSNPIKECQSLIISHSKFSKFCNSFCSLILFLFFRYCKLEVYTSEKFGNDDAGDGSEDKPFKTILQAMRFLSVEPFPPIYVDAKTEGKVKLIIFIYRLLKFSNLRLISLLQKFEPVAKSQFKKIHKLWQREQYKISDKAKKEEEDAQKRSKNLEEAKKHVLEEDKSLSPAKCIKIVDGKSYENVRVKIFGWIHRLRKQSKI